MILRKLARLEMIEYSESDNVSESARIVGNGYQAFIHLSGIIDTAEEKKRLDAEKENLIHYQRSLAERLADPNFSKRAPAHIIAQNQTTLQETEAKILDLEKASENLV